MITKPERWRPVPGWEGLYDVSDCGRARSRNRTIYVRNPHGVMGSRTYLGRMLAQSVSKLGYPMISLTAPGRKREYLFIHTAVAAAFIGPRPAGHDVCHKDQDKTNNFLVNLRYDTRKGNRQDEVALGLYSIRSRTGIATRLLRQAEEI